MTLICTLHLRLEVSVEPIPQIWVRFLYDSFGILNRDSESIPTIPIPKIGKKGIVGISSCSFVKNSKFLVYSSIRHAFTMQRRLF